jgi:hypothetical protein
MSKKPPKPISPLRKSLAREKPKFAPLSIYYIFSEGKITEPEYINNFYRELCKNRKIILAPVTKAAGVPMTIVEACVAKKIELCRAAKRDSFEKNFVLWAIFDIDAHPKIDEAIVLAKANGIRCIISNPCVEVWGLMHTSLYERPLTRHEAQNELTRAMPGYHHDRSPIFPWELCKKNIDLAINNSAKALDRRTYEHKIFPNGNPSTNFHELLIALRAEEEISKH